MNVCLGYWLWRVRRLTLGCKLISIYSDKNKLTYFFVIFAWLAIVLVGFSYSIFYVGDRSNADLVDNFSIKYIDDTNNPLTVEQVHNMPDSVFADDKQQMHQPDSLDFSMWYKIRVKGDERFRTAFSITVDNPTLDLIHFNIHYQGKVVFDKKLGDQIAGLTLVEAKELSDYLKDEHGIEAAAGGAVVMTGGGGGGGSRTVEGTTFVYAGGGGGAGYTTGQGAPSYVNPSIRTISAVDGEDGTYTTGGARGEASGFSNEGPIVNANGAVGGDLGEDGADALFDGSLGGSAGKAIDLNGFTITYVNTGTIEGVIS